MKFAIRNSQFAIHSLVFLLFVVITLAFTYPLIVQMSTHFAGDNVDVWLNMWANWWTRKALREGLPFYHTTDILYPDGASLYFHSFSHTNTALWLILAPLMGALAAHNVTTLVGFVLLGFGVYLMVHELTGHTGAGIVAGLAATFAPYHVWECVHPSIFSTQYIPLLLWSLIVLFRRPTWRRGLLVGLFFALNVFTSWHQPMYASVMVGPYLVWSLFARRERWGEKSLWRALLVAALVVAVLVGPLLFPLLREQLRAGYAQVDVEAVLGTDLLALVTPSFLHPLWGRAVRPFYDRFSAPNRPAFVGYTVLALALLGLYRLWRERRREHGWLLAATLLALVLALGTRLCVNGDVILPNLPWYEPIIGFIRTPIRLNLVLGQCLAVLAGFGVARLSSTTRRSFPHCSLFIVSLFILLEFLAWPFPTTPAYVPPFYDQLAQEPGTFAIVEAPQDRQTDKFYMYWQTIHEKPLVNGHVSRPSGAAFDFIQGNDITRAFARRELLRGQVRLGTEMEALNEAGVRYIVVHKQFLPPELAADWIAALATLPAYEDDDLVVFATRPEPGVHFGVAHDFDGLLLSQAWLEPGQSSVLESHWSSPERRAITVTLRAAGTTLYTQMLIVEQGAFSVLRTPLILPDLPADAYVLSLTSETRTFDVCRLTFDVSRLTFGFCAQLQPNATWGDSILLRGVNWHRLANTLYIDLQWEARQHPGADYKFFVHLSRDDGTLVAQFDGMPRNWAYPTSLWPAGELIADQAQIDLRDVPAGAYRLAIGWYDPETGQRLLGLDASGQPLPEGLLLLDQAVVIP